MNHVRFFDGDISPEYFNLVYHDKIVSVDLETSGLDWSKDKIAICQLHSHRAGVAVVKIDQKAPALISDLISSRTIKKIFHFAVFDLRFMYKHWQVRSNNIVCTKIASKIIDSSGEHSLQGLLRSYLGIYIDKSARLSNWFATELSDEQINYAVRDVIYLADLYKCLSKAIKNHGSEKLLRQANRFIPVQVELDVMGVSDVFEY